MSNWFVANIIERYLEPFCLGGGIFVVAAIGLVVGFVFVVRDWKRERRRRRQLKENCMVGPNIWITKLKK